MRNVADRILQRSHEPGQPEWDPAHDLMELAGRLEDARGAMMSAVTGQPDSARTGRPAPRKPRRPRGQPSRGGQENGVVQRLDQLQSVVGELTERVHWWRLLLDQTAEPCIASDTLWLARIA